MALAIKEHSIRKEDIINTLDVMWTALDCQYITTKPQSQSILQKSHKISGIILIKTLSLGSSQHRKQLS